MSIQQINEESKIILQKNLEEIRRGIEEAKTAAGREADVMLLAATKTVSAEVINYVTQTLGVRNIGENRVQELLDKYEALDLTNVDVHFIGKLQSNKVKYIIDKVSLIHSLDSLSLADEIDSRSRRLGKKTDCLIEVNIGREESKSGVMPEDFEDFLAEVQKREAISVRGLMTIAPLSADAEEKKKYFSETYSIFIDILQKKIHNINIPILSMGMSGSYKEAIACGSDCVRIGSSLFGERIYNR
ncbi:MAG: YggS family pyridoxal phosphate-dependent enzyme [Ruminococcaceae bacterium]|nr:YggS family pyridoxal phosphate-dependent enzyme [Oscillospiraceae bacterium]